MKIAIVQDWLRTGGTEKHTVHLANRFKAAGHDAVVVTCRPGGPLSENLDARRVSLQPFDARCNIWTPGLTTTLRREEPDIILLMGKVANCRGVRIKERVPEAVVVGTLRTGNPIPHHYERSLCLDDAVVCNAEWTAERARKIGVAKDRVLVAPNAVGRDWDWEKRAFHRAKIREEQGVGEASVFVKVAGFRPGKGQSELIHALAHFRPQEDWRLWLAGDGSTRRECEGMARDFGLSDRVTFWGNVPDPYPLLAGADVAVFTSQAESQPNALVEAQWCGLPVVAYCTGGVRECFMPDISGYAAPLNDSEAFCQKLSLLVDDSALRSTMSERGRAFAVEKFQSGDNAVRYLDLFERLLRKRRTEI
ncbi:glycosyltransferase family 4 protein [Cerasicoccus maritimus]|uniref:glycosyltransferase family 4 protein n=1 Tax=Cerasicoccus maritimus TaxID=490089 RepID=UPI0028524A63|nr:glycosyltransferase family 4 protein [Cerasicoccus maritimus]